MLADLLPSSTPLVSEYFSFLMVTGIFGGLFAFFKQHNCHHHLCPRLSWHTDKTGHPVCKHHHPDHPKHSRSQEWGERWLIKHGIKKPVVTVHQDGPESS